MCWCSEKQISWKIWYGTGWWRRKGGGDATEWGAEDAGRDVSEECELCEDVEVRARGRERDRESERS